MPRDGKHLKAHQFKPGQTGNPEGARRHNPIAKALKNLTVEAYRDIIKAACCGNLDHLRAMVKNPKMSALQVGVAQALAKAIERGDVEVVERLVSRIVGKIPDEINVNATNVNLNAEIDVPAEKVKAAIAKVMGDL